MIIHLSLIKNFLELAPPKPKSIPTARTRKRNAKCGGVGRTSNFVGRIYRCDILCDIRGSFFRAIRQGFRITRVYQGWIFDESSDDLFCDFMKTYAKLK